MKQMSSNITPKLIFLIINVFLFFSISEVKSDSVCTLKMLQAEIREDLADNNMLDCLREIPPPNGKEENEAQKNTRIYAQWTTSCSFEAAGNWLDTMKNSFGIKSLVTSSGEPVNEDFHNQADICEIIRAAIAYKKIKVENLNMRDIPAEQVIPQIKCSNDSSNPKKTIPSICAASNGSFFNRDNWKIFLSPSIITFDNKPKMEAKKGGNNNRQRRHHYEKFPQEVEKLMKIPKSELEKNGGDLSKALDRNNRGNGSSKKAENSGNLVNLAANNADVSLDATQSYTQVPMQGLTIPEKAERTIIGFVMISYSSAIEESLSIRIKYNGNAQSESRATSGNKQADAFSTAFAVNTASDGYAHGIITEYKTPKQFKIKTNTEESNFSQGLISLPKSNMYIYKNNSVIDLVPNRQYEPINTASLFIKNNFESPRKYLVFYNLTVFSSTFKLIFSTVLKNNKGIDYKDTLTTRTTMNNITNHGATVIELASKEETTLSLNYLLSEGPSLQINNNNNEDEVVGITAVELPNRTEIKHKEAPNTILTCSGGWKDMEIKLSVDLVNSVNPITILFHYNYKVNGGIFRTRLTANKRAVKRTTSSQSNSITASGQGWVNMYLPKGFFTIEMQYYCENGEQEGGQNTDFASITALIYPK